MGGRFLISCLLSGLVSVVKYLLFGGYVLTLASGATGPPTTAEYFKSLRIPFPQSLATPFSFHDLILILALSKPLDPFPVILDRNLSTTQPQSWYVDYPASDHPTLDYSTSDYPTSDYPTSDDYPSA